MTNNSTLPLWLAFVSALFWGIWWMPVRALESTGLTGAWAGTALIGGALPLLLILFFFGKKRGQDTVTPDVRAVASGALIGGAMMLYSAAITDTTVVRAILLFYLAPAWAIALECVFMGRKLRAINGLAFAVAALGVVITFRGEISLSHWNKGDLFALVSGMCWAAGSALVFTGPDIGARTLSLFGSAGGAIIGLFLVLSSGAPVPVLDTATTASLLAIGTGTFYIAPVLIATLWSARRLNPTTLAFLLTGEIISGIATSAWFLSEPFGWPELIGSSLIVSAALIEVVSPKT